MQILVMTMEGILLSKEKLQEVILVHFNEYHYDWLNVIAFIILYYSNLFGGTDEMIRSGALSWYYVKNKGNITVS